MSMNLPYSFSIVSDDEKNPWSYTDQDVRDSVGKARTMQELVQCGLQLELMLASLEKNNPDKSTDLLDNAWAHYCYEAVTKARRIGIQRIDEKRLRGKVLINPKLREDLYDNYVEVALALGQSDRLFDSPAVAWCAFNKHNYAGCQDEIVILRLLLCLGFNPNIPDDNGMTALHYMAYQLHNQDSHPRAVRLLLKAGANPNAKNRDGMTPLDFMLDRQGWTDNLQQSAVQLVKAGGSLFHFTKDENLMSYLSEKKQTKEQVTELILAMVWGAVAR